MKNQIKVGALVPRARYFDDQETREVLERKGIQQDASIDDSTSEVVQHDLDDIDADSTNNDASLPASSFYGKDTTLNCENFDLAKKQAMCTIAQYCWDVRKMILRKFYDEYLANTDGVPPM